MCILISKLQNLQVPLTFQGVQKLQEGTKEPPVDWTLRTKVRFMAQKPFPWNTTLRTCEEASGITGYKFNVKRFKR